MNWLKTSAYSILFCLLCGCLTIPAVAASSRHVVLISDLHVGAGKAASGSWKPFEDFRWHDDFTAFLEMVSKRSDSSADLVLVGDIFELWQSPLMECSTNPSKPGCDKIDCHHTNKNIGCGEAEAAGRLRQVLAQHPEFIKAIQLFAGKGTNRVIFVPGNHDAALLFPAVGKLLLEQFDRPRISVAGNGYWLSEDGAIYADHGHQFDEVNKFIGWPSPFTELDGHNYLVRPWGENMVQQFYNQYESAFPIIDNLSDERVGVGYAVRQVGFPDTAGAIRRFFRFFVFEQSLRQAGTALGETGKTHWNYAAVRAEKPGFFLEVIAADSKWRAQAEDLRPTASDGFVPTELSDVEIDALCIAKDTVEGARRCPRITDNLSAVATALTTTPQQRLVSYLQSTLPRVAAPGARIASVYVFGHTHAAAPPVRLALGEMAFGSAEVVVANTGAFQRIATPVQIDAILQTEKQRGKRPLDLQPEDLPACYTFIWISPYGLEREPVPQLQQWSLNKNALRTADGTCT